MGGMSNNAARTLAVLALVLAAVIFGMVQQQIENPMRSIFFVALVLLIGYALAGGLPIASGPFYYISFVILTRDKTDALAGVDLGSAYSITHPLDMIGRIRREAEQQAGQGFTCAVGLLHWCYIGRKQYQAGWAETVDSLAQTWKKGEDDGDSDAWNVF